MPNMIGSKIPSESKIIVGVERSKSTGWLSLHLHDCLYAVSVRPDQGVVVIAEGRGRNRLQNTRIPIKNILRFEAPEVPIGHNCVTFPVNSDSVGNCELISEDHPFAPISVRMIITGGKTSFVSIYDLGATPLPILVPLLNELPKRAIGNSSNGVPTSANDCITLHKKVKSWVQDVNKQIKDFKVSDKLQDIYTELEKYDQLDAQQTLFNVLSSIIVSVTLHKAGKKFKKPARVRHSFPISLANLANDAGSPPRHVNVDDLNKISIKYQKETDRPIQEVFEVISEHIADLKNRKIDSSGDLGLFETSQRDINIIEPIRKINEKQRVLSELELRHEDQLKIIFENEKISVCFVERLPFLSLLAEYISEDGETHHAVVIREGLHQAHKEFLLAHEMGHWFLHRDFTSKRGSYLSSSGYRTPMEIEADDFGMAVLFPAAYLADCAIFQGELSEEDLLNEFIKDMDPVGPKLKNEMLINIERHIKRYKNFKDAKVPPGFSIEVKSIDEKNIESLLEIIHDAKKSVCWVRLDIESKIKGHSDSFAELFGRSKEELIHMSPMELVVPEEKPRMQQRFNHRMDKKQAIYYFTEIKNERQGSSRQVIIYSFPILNDGEYAGSMGILIPIDHIESESLRPQVDAEH